MPDFWLKELTGPHQRPTPVKSKVTDQQTHAFPAVVDPKLVALKTAHLNHQGWLFVSGCFDERGAQYAKEWGHEEGWGRPHAEAGQLVLAPKTVGPGGKLLDLLEGPGG